MRRHGKYILFTWVSKALLARRVSRSFRTWSPEYAQKFHAGDVIDAYDFSPRLNGKRIATIKLISDPVQSHSAGLSQDDQIACGFTYLSHIGAKASGELTPLAYWFKLVHSSVPGYLIDFEILKTFPRETDKFSPEISSNQTTLL